MPLSGVEFEKKTDYLFKKVLDFYEDVRYKYLSAKEDPKTYGDKWEKSVKKIREDFDGLSEFSQKIKENLTEDVVFSKEVLNPESSKAEELYNEVKLLRFESDSVNDPFSKQMGDKVVEKLVGNKTLFAQFLHYALRNHTHRIQDSVWEENDLEPDDITQCAKGLDLLATDIPLYIIEHYGDDVDTSRVKGKFKGALELLKKVFLSKHTEEQWNALVEVSKKNVIKKEEKSEDEKEDIDFIIPNKPMYRIFEVKDIKELKGFSGEWVVQEKYDGIRIQLHKIDKKIKIYTYNEKDITEKCKDIAEIMKQKKFGDMILDGELILYDNDEPLHRADTIAHLFKNKYPDAVLKARVFDIMNHDGKSLLDSTLRDRINILFYQLSSLSEDLLGFPSKKNTRIADSLKEVEKYSKDIMDLPASEGVVIKDIESTYYVGTKKNPKWIKWKKFVDLDVMVLDKSKTKSGLYSYTLGIGPLTGEETREYGGTEIKGKTYLKVGKALNTKEKVEIGAIVRVKVDEVRRKGKGFSLYSAKVIEIPEVEQPEKLVTLLLLSEEGKKTLKYDVKEALLKYTITDGIHGSAEIILKADTEGYTIYGFDGDSLMEKNALADIDMWKQELESIYKSKSGEARVALHNYLQQEDENKKGVNLREIFTYANKQIPELVEQLWDNNVTKMKNWMNDFDEFIQIDHNNYTYNDKIIIKDEPQDSRKGKYKLFTRKDDNLDLVIEVNDKTMAWTIDIENNEDIYNLFGKAGKFPAQMTNKVQKEKLLDKGEIILGVQKHGYHEYKIDGNKFKTRLHFRVVPVKGEDKWLVWTGYKQKMLDTGEDMGIWDISEDRHKNLGMSFS